MTVAVLAWTVNPLVLLITVWPTGLGRNCSSPSDAPDYVPPGCPREGLVVLAGMFVLGCWILVTGVVGLACGVVEGARHRFAKGVVVPAVLVTIAAPWAMAAFAVGAGLAWLVTAADRPRVGQSRG
ncbi:hypothetical protein ODJ79_15325 [Actinoplanes sp. KI2]|uniref:hypothetical protein n=1 Tax=Actinoplanes sp. KI2 TaxID=2983315 RepID=UPI0021D56B27|nr:hypothetical protein [Actinoplanes sp. KI2]MCU7725097.1 hypothetical protein [Actinoplanes sp. KI2]